MEEINNAPTPEYVGGLLQRIEKLENDYEGLLSSYKAEVDGSRELGDTLREIQAMVDPELQQASREELLKRLETQLNELVKLDKENHNLQNTLKITNDSLETYKHEMKRLETLVHEHIDDKESFFDAVVEAFDIELTKYVTKELTVTVQVQAKVPIEMDDEEIEEELKSAKLDYEFLGNGDIVIEDFSFGDLEVE